MLFLTLASEFLGCIDFKESQIIHPQRSVFICGGVIGGEATAPSSMRELLMSHAEKSSNPGEFLGSKILLAEEAINALADSNFENLLDLEEYIAAIVGSIILIVESPGSICELGAFVMVAKIREKLVVIAKTEHLTVPSFITKGAIKYFQDNHSDPQILGYHWITDAGNAVRAEDYVLNKMIADIPASIETINPKKGRSLFKFENNGHKIYLVLSICHVLRSAKFSDIKAILSEVGLSIEDGELWRCLDILEICGLVKKVTHGKPPSYFVARVTGLPLDIHWKATTPNRDRNTLRWIQRIAEEVTKTEPDRIAIFRDHHGA